MKFQWVFVFVAHATVFVASSPIFTRFKTYGDDSKVVTAEWLNSEIEKGNSNLRVFDTDSLENYDTGHIPSARHLDIKELRNSSHVNEHHKNHPVHPLIFEEHLQSLGLNKESHVVLYDHGKTNESIINSTYIYWLFKVYGSSNKVSLLQNGLRGWIGKNFSITNQPEPNVTQPGNYKATWDYSVIATYNDILENNRTKKYQLVDTRENTTFANGSISDSLNIPNSLLLTPDVLFQKSRLELARFLGQFGVPKRHVIVTCNTGNRATVLYYLLDKLDYYRSSVYSGSWSEWSKRQGIKGGRCGG